MDHYRKKPVKNNYAITHLCKIWNLMLNQKITSNNSEYRLMIIDLLTRYPQIAYWLRKTKVGEYPGICPVDTSIAGVYEISEDIFTISFISYLVSIKENKKMTSTGCMYPLIGMSSRHECMEMNNANSIIFQPL